MTSTTPISATRTESIAPPARVALIAGIAYAVLLTVLHFVRSDVSIEWQTTSEYARGSAGWVMVIAFLLSAISLGALVVSAWAIVRSVPGRIGLIALAIAALGTAVGGVFVTDPIETPQSELTTSGTVHGLAAGLALMLTPVAAILINLALARRTDSRSARIVLRVSAFVPLAALVMFMSVQTALLPESGLFGPGVPIGPAERVLVAAFAAWQITTAVILWRRRSWSATPVRPA